MRSIILTTTVEEIYQRQKLDADTGLRSWEFYRAVIQEAIDRGLISLDTDGIDVIVSVEPEA